MTKKNENFLLNELKYQNKSLLDWIVFLNHIELEVLTDEDESLFSFVRNYKKQRKIRGNIANQTTDFAFMLVCFSLIRKEHYNLIPEIKVQEWLARKSNIKLPSKLMVMNLKTFIKYMKKAIATDNWIWRPHPKNSVLKSSFVFNGEIVIPYTSFVKLCSSVSQLIDEL